MIDYTRFSLTSADPTDIGASDLLEEAREALAAGDPDIRCFRATLRTADGRESAEDAQVVMIDRRMGVSWGGDATWGRVYGPDDDEGQVEAAFADWLNDADAWYARN